MSEFKKKYIVIKNNRDFSFLFKRGESIVTFAFVCYVRERRGRCNRLGIVTGKKVGNAVKRNRSSLFEPILKEKTQKRYDFVFVARSKTPELKSTKIYSLMMKNILSRLSWSIFSLLSSSCTDLRCQRSYRRAAAIIQAVPNTGLPLFGVLVRWGAVIWRYGELCGATLSVQAASTLCRRSSVFTPRGCLCRRISGYLTTTAQTTSAKI